MKKEQLPSKICIICKRPFNWRKKWSKVWNEVKYCSNACKKKKLIQVRQKVTNFMVENLIFNG